MAPLTMWTMHHESELPTDSNQRPYPRSGGYVKVELVTAPVYFYFSLAIACAKHFRSGADSARRRWTLAAAANSDSKSNRIITLSLGPN